MCIQGTAFKTKIRYNVLLKWRIANPQLFSARIANPCGHVLTKTVTKTKTYNTIMQGIIFQAKIYCGLFLNRCVMTIRNKS